MSPRDAQLYWASARMPNDQYLLYAFEDLGASWTSVRDFVAGRTWSIPDLRVRVEDVPAHLDYPYWVTREFGDDQLVEHPLEDPTWQRCLDDVARRLGDGVDARVSPWRLHLYRAVRGVPGCADAPAVVAVLQLSHALADGRRAAAIARALFGPEPADQPPPEHLAVPTTPTTLTRAVLRLPGQGAGLVVRGVEAFRAHRDERALVERGELPAPLASRPPTALNSPPGPRHDLRVVVRPLSALRAEGVTVTVAALTAISLALPRYLAEHGSPHVPRLGAEVTVADSVAQSSPVLSRNNFRNISVDLFPDEPDLEVRAGQIATVLAGRRVRSAHELVRRQERTLDVLPAALLHAGIAGQAVDRAPEAVSGHTVLTSVDRGAADLSLLGGRVLLTAGFPALSSAMALTHGVYGIGDTVTVSAHSGRAVLPDPDRYAAILGESIDAVGRVLRR
ncbi:wax ester/triacylglycerol synthase domain-containing protein [Speluncibacter jeojiensis]|uniref:O-acyltransferase WSD1-like N-terminal domain-containing protein n=1 Tax=Speluncibacter jeojiensis TaxID=2710754 RepID=A0A9X4LZW2_9ACTN|nr:hypothetical protein [Corynebacteriales bacterium D3-21]